MPSTTLSKMRFDRLRGLTALAACLIAGCTTVIHAPDDPVDDGLRPEAIERGLTRDSHPATNLRVIATLWSTALIAADHRARRGSEPEPTVYEPTEEIEHRHARWIERYVREGTTFTVVIELANRPRLGKGDTDPLVEPSAWSFRLDRGEARGLAPLRVAVQAVDRFPTRAGGYHYRIAYEVQFSGPLYEGLDPADSTRLRLYVRPRERGPRPTSFGRAASRSGFALTWHVEPAAAADSFSVARRR